MDGPRGSTEDAEHGRGIAAAFFPFAHRSGQSNAAPTMIFRINNHGDPCEIEFVCVG